MPTDVVMPQMGESIAEGTVIRWMKKVGDKVERDEPMFEISTDKVDAEIPAPASGILTEILAAEGATVAVNSVVARLSGEGEASAPAAGPPAAATSAASSPAAKPAEPGPVPTADESGAESPQAGANAAMASDVAQEASGVSPSDSTPVAKTPAPAPKTAAPVPAAAAEKPQPDTAATSGGAKASADVTSLDERRRTKSSPLVRKIANENDIDITNISGSGISGRVTKKDILDYMEAPRAAEQEHAQQPSIAPGSSPAVSPVSFKAGENVRIEPMSVMRKRIAHHMIVSKQTSAHVTTLFEVDFTKIDKLRKRYKEHYAERGAKLTYLPFIVQALVTGLREYPILNSSIDGESIVYRKDLNIGIAVALDWGLIVPVVKNADEKNILGLARTINDLGERARTKKLSPDEVQGGTFTITNPGIYGGLFGTPIINQPQVAILGVGGVKKRAVVIETDEGDAIVVRSMCYLALTFDHRIIDGALADQFMAKVKATIEKGQFTL
ncbi:MAG TPA: dihydrolipoamide acetyltransferase family protein [Thermoanaerobaculia bacterium]|nr:dihydrolipoamide acetyltransferase family protein [Thermoanaerobaculia bacterium]